MGRLTLILPVTKTVTSWIDAGEITVADNFLRQAIKHKSSNYTNFWGQAHNLIVITGF